MFFSYKTTYKITIGYNPYQLVYGLNPLMSTKDILLTFSGDHRNANPIRVLTNRLIELGENPLRCTT
jgi:hypothetical protein